MPKSQNPSNPNNIGFRIRELRLKKGLSQAKLAHLLDCAQNTITEWETRKGRAPGKKLLGKVAQVLEVSIDYLVGGDKIEKPQIPYYGEIVSKEFVWNPEKTKDYIEVPQSEYTPVRFSFKIIDDLLEPIVCRGDYGIFENLPVEDGDIVVIRFLEDKDNGKAMIKRWRQQGNAVMLLEINPRKIYSPYFCQITRPPDKNSPYKLHSQPGKNISVEGKLVAVKRVVKSILDFPKINYIFS